MSTMDSSAAFAMAASRGAGSDGSSGTKAAPDLSIPSMPTVISIDRSINSPTRVSGRTPRIATTPPRGGTAH